MNAATIGRLLEYLPDRGISMYAHRTLSGCGRASDLVDSSGPSSVFDDEISAAEIAYRDTGFAWRFIRFCAAHRIDFPEFVECNEEGILLRRAYNMERYRQRDAEIMRAVGLAKPTSGFARGVIESLLISPSIDLKEACGRIGVKVSEVAVYEKLFYNVIDRAQDTLHILEKIYPEGRPSEFFAESMRSTDMQLMLKRSGYKNGLNELLWMIGHASGEEFYHASAADKTIPAKFEAMIMVNGYFLARNGFSFQNSAVAPAMAAARGMLNAAKQGGAPEGGAGGAGGVEDLIGMGEVIMKEMTEFGQIGKNRRAELIRVRNMEREADVRSAEGSVA